jgi:TRAP-type C4-dicarboxylate transport system substrate-binding protein
MSSWVGPTTSLTRDVLTVWAKNVEAATQGRVKFEMLPKHPSAPPGTFDAVRDGLVDVSFVTASYTPARHPLPLMAELPGAGAHGRDQLGRVLARPLEVPSAGNEYKGVKLLGVFTHGPGQMFTVKKPVTSVADLAGMKIRSGGGISEAAAKALGASPLVKPAPESYELLSSGVADGTFFPSESIKSFNLDKVVKYATYFPGGFYSSSFGFFMNEDKWNKLPKQDQDAILSVSGEALARLAGKLVGRGRQGGFEALKAANVQIIEPARPSSPTCASAPTAGAGVDQVGEREGRRRREGLGRVPGRAEEGRGRQVMNVSTTPEPAAEAARFARPRHALTACAWILADEGHESGLAGQLTARGPNAGTFWTLPLGLASTRRRGVLAADRRRAARARGRRFVRHTRAESGHALPPWVYRARSDVGAIVHTHPPAHRRSPRPNSRSSSLTWMRRRCSTTPPSCPMAGPPDRRSRRRIIAGALAIEATRCCSPTTGC